MLRTKTRQKGEKERKKRIGGTIKMEFGFKALDLEAKKARWWIIWFFFVGVSGGDKLRIKLN